MLINEEINNLKQLAYSLKYQNEELKKQNTQIIVLNSVIYVTA